MTLALLVAFVVAQFAPAPLSDVIKRYNKINHNLRRSFCSGFRLLRRKAENVEDYKNLFPIVGLDTNEQNELYCVLCDHLPCRNSNVEIEYTLGSLCLQNKLERKTLNSLRPVFF